MYSTLVFQKDVHNPWILIPRKVKKMFITPGDCIPRKAKKMFITPGS